MAKVPTGVALKAKDRLVIQKQGTVGTLNLTLLSHSMNFGVLKLVIIVVLNVFLFYLN